MLYIAVGRQYAHNMIAAAAALLSLLPFFFLLFLFYFSAKWFYFTNLRLFAFVSRRIFAPNCCFFFSLAFIVRVEHFFDNNYNDDDAYFTFLLNHLCFIWHGTHQSESKSVIKKVDKQRSTVIDWWLPIAFIIYSIRWCKWEYRMTESHEMNV